MPSPTQADIKAALLASYAATGFTMVPDPVRPGKFVLDEFADSQATAMHNFLTTWQANQIVKGILVDAVNVIGGPYDPRAIPPRIDGLP